MVNATITRVFLLWENRSVSQTLPVMMALFAMMAMIQPSLIHAAPAQRLVWASVNKKVLWIRIKHLNWKQQRATIMSESCSKKILHVLVERKN
jgi:hypothetical protein